MEFLELIADQLDYFDLKDNFFCQIERYIVCKIILRLQ